ncbi:MAG TPA: ADOP family duplicated permease [Gemmatimonadaceae bacterium]|jgi:predicted permease|nr:ADOP family duplicated permease [Gemmatimonadaceae bacterium]
MPTPAALPLEVRSSPWSALWQDLRYAARGLRNTPGFTWAVVITLALGIGANVAMFSIVDRLLFRAPPMLHDAARVHRVYLGSTFRGKEGFNNTIPYARYVDLTRGTRSFTRTAEFSSPDVAIGVGNDAREMPVGVVSASFFGFFDAPPALGRYFTTSEDQPPSGTPVAVLSYGLWQTRYGGRRDVLGQTLQIGATLYTIIGVAPRGFVGLWSDKPPAAFVPITVRGGEMGANVHIPGERWWTTYHWYWASMMVERKPGVSVAAANADLSRVYRQGYAAQQAKEPHMPPIALMRPRAVVASILRDRGPNESPVARVATWISGVALIVWLIACANVANLLLARALRRRREIAVRLALGVSRVRLMVQLFAESVLLALLGAAAGVLVAQWGGALLRAALLPRTAAGTVVSDPRTLLLAGIAALSTGLLTGLAPIAQSRHTNLARDLKAGAREGTYHRSRLRVGLLVFQGALSVVLLVGAGLFVRSLHNVRNVPLGYDANSLLAVELQMRDVKLDSAQSVTLRQRLLDEVTTIPGVEHAARQLTTPFRSMWDFDLHVAGIDSVSRLGEFDLNAVTPDYFATMGTRVVQGRGITAADVQGAPGAMVVSQAMARTLWPGQNAIGQCVKVGADTVPCTYVVGVAENIKQTSLSDDAGLYYYLSAPQFHPDQGGLFVRVHGAASGQTETVRRRLQRLMPGTSYVTVTPMSDVLGEETQSWQMGATMFAVFGLLALALAAIGLYSVIAYNVAQRTHELGVRAALGAQMRDLAGLVVREAMTLAAAGLLLGAAIALVAGTWVKPLLFEVSPRNPWIYILVALVLLAVAAVASFVPARRAARVDPMQALRAE